MRNSITGITILILSIFVFIGVVGIAKTADARPPTDRKGKPVFLVKESRANIEIVKPSSATDFESQAADDLKEYLEKVTDATIVIKHEDEVIEKIPVYVGRCLASQHLVGTAESLINDGYVIQINADSIHLLGKNDLATRFAVYGFLEDYIGVHWFMPEVWGDGFPENMGTHIPQKDTIALKTILDTQDPSFKYRKIGGTPWSIQNKMNFIGEDHHGFQTNATGSSFWQFVNPCKCTYWDNQELFRVLDGEPLSSGDRKATCGDVCKDEDETQSNTIKLNVGNLATRDAMVTEVVTDIDENPEIDIINLFPNDLLDFCESPESKAMDGLNSGNFTVDELNDYGRELGEEFGRILSKRYTMFYHDVTERILELRPDKFLMTAAYSAYQYAPFEVTDTDFVSEYKMDDRVMLLTTHYHEHNHPIEERSTEPNSYFHESVKCWKRLYSRLGVYEYYRKTRMHELPFPIIHSIRRDIPYYYNTGFSYFYTQYSPYDIGTYGLLYYIAAKLVWDVNADVDKLLQDFYTKFYGDAAEPMRLYHEILEFAAINSDLELYPKYYGAYLDLFTDEVMQECSDHLGAAMKVYKKAADSNAVYLKRIELSEISLAYTKSIIEYLKEIKNLFHNKVLWRTYTTDVVQLAEQLALKIESMITEVEPYRTIFRQGRQITNLLTWQTALNSVRKYFYPEIVPEEPWIDPEENFTKTKWITKNGIRAKRGYGDVEFFDIWVFARDVNYSDRFGAEHRIDVLDKNDNIVEVARFAESVEEAGDNIDKGFLRSNFSFNELIGSSDEITLKIYNYYGGGDTKFYAIAIMPHMDIMDQDKATWHYLNDINYIREKALGFIEFHERKLDYETLEVVLDLFSHPESGDDDCVLSASVNRSKNFWVQ